LGNTFGNNWSQPIRNIGNGPWIGMHMTPEHVTFKILRIRPGVLLPSLASDALRRFEPVSEGQA